MPDYLTCPASMKKPYVVLLIILSFTVIFSFLSEEHFNSPEPIDDHVGVIDRFISRLYFTTITASTIGFGDITPRSNTARLLTIVMICIMFLTILL